MKTKKIMSLVLAVLMFVGTVIMSGVTSAEEPLYEDTVGHWGYEHIKFVTESGLMNGVGGGRFDPDGKMDRAMVVTVLYRYAGSPAVEGENKFTDVPAGEWYETPVIWAADRGIVKGVGDNKYEPLTSITREDLTTIMMRYAKMQAHIDTDKTKDISGYEDYSSISDYAIEAMEWANATEIVTGITETKLGPTDGATRAEYATIIERFDKAFGIEYNAPVYGQNYVEPEYEKVEDADIYVSTTGSDDASGTKTDPIATFAEAKERVRELKGTKKGDIKVAFFAGEYGSLDNLTFSAADSGTADQTITYCAYGDGDVVFRNGIEILNSDFKPITTEEAKMFPEEARDNIYKVDLNGKVDALSSKSILFSQKGACDEARYPNKWDDGSDYYYLNQTTRYEDPEKEEWEYDTLIVSAKVKVALDKFSTYDGLKVTGYLRTGWFQDTFPVKSYDKTTRHLVFDFDNYEFAEGWDREEYPLAYEGRMSDSIYFHNLAEFLDRDGEYWFDTDTKTLYVYNPIGNYAIPTSGTYLTLDYYSSYINIVGLEFNGSTENAIESWGDNITFDRCTIGNVNGTAAIFGEGVTGFTATNNEIFGFVCGGISLRSDVNKYILEESNIVINNNYFHDFGLPQYFDGAVAIQLFSTVGTEIANNEFVNGSHGAIRYDACIDTIIEYNVFDNMMINTQDFGAVYTWEDITYRDNTIRYNLFTNMRHNEAVHGIYFDGSYGDIVYGNLFYNVGGDNILLNGGRDNQVHDNISVSTRVQKGTFVTNIDHGYNYANGTGGSAHYDALGYLENKPKQGEAGYDKWIERWEILYKYSTNVNDHGDPDCALTMINVVTDNAVIGSRFYSGETFEVYSVVENNGLYGVGENPYFADPANGDYTIENTEDFNTEYMFDFAKVGRQ